MPPAANDRGMPVNYGQASLIIFDNFKRDSMPQAPYKRGNRTVAARVAYSRRTKPGIDGTRRSLRENLLTPGFHSVLGKPLYRGGTLT